MVTDPMQVLSANNQIPSSGMMNTLSGISIGSNILNAGFNIYGKYLEYKAIDDQIGADLHALEVEKLYNVKNFKQKIADTLASNKMSFYSSGLDINTGTARNVIESNRTAGLEDLEQMEARYNTQIQNLKDKRNALEKKKIAGMTSYILGGAQ